MTRTVINTSETQIGNASHVFDFMMQRLVKWKNSSNYDAYLLIRWHFGNRCCLVSERRLVPQTTATLR